MPELPEVQTVCTTLKLLILNKKIDNVEVMYEKILKNSDNIEFCNKLSNQTLLDIRRIGKYILFDFDKYTLVSHLRMEGKYNYYEDTDNYKKHDLVSFNFTDNTQLVYNDVRKFGTMELVLKGEEDSLKSIKVLGYEPFDKRVTIDYLKEKIKNRKTTVKQFLLDQSVLTGLGNIYVDEVLFLCKIHPLTTINNLTNDDLNNIIQVSIKVLNKAISEGGTTVKSFAISGNVTGMFQHSLNVYQRAKQECFVCNGIISKIKVGGRGTHFCENCQKIK